MSAAVPVLAVDHVTKRYGKTTAVDGVSVSLGAGEVLAVVGPSGCGKSTLLKVIAGLEGVDGGTVHLAGRLLCGDGVFVPTEKRGVGIVFQDLALFPHLTVGQNVEFGLRHRRDGGPQDVSSVADMVKLVGLEGKVERYPHELSGGEQQRVAIARALALKPDLVLLDEPFSHLDRGLAVQVRTEAMTVLRAAGASVVLVTHDQEEALAVGDRVAVMRGGRLQQVGSPHQVYSRPRTTFVARFVGEADFLPGERKGDVAQTVLGDVPVEEGADGPVTVMVRPHDLTVEPVSGGPLGGATGEVVAREFRGSHMLHVVDVGDGVTVRAVAPPVAGFDVGSRVRIPTPTLSTLAVVTE